VFRVVPDAYDWAVIDAPVMVGHAEEEATPLSPAQTRFARKNGALVGPEAYGGGGAVFLYREGPMLTRRWLVDRTGRVVQYDTFARSA
jgi:hypothetical protein